MILGSELGEQVAIGTFSCDFHHILHHHYILSNNNSNNIYIFQICLTTLRTICFIVSISYLELLEICCSIYKSCTCYVYFKQITVVNDEGKKLQNLFIYLGVSSEYYHNRWWFPDPVPCAYHLIMMG